MIGVAATDFEDKILNANTAFLQMVGYTVEDLKSGTLCWSAISLEEYDDIDAKKMAELHAHTSIIPFEKEYVHKKGYRIPVLVGAEILDAASTVGVCFALDISTMKESERRKEAFAALVSHELRTPLSIMKISADILVAQVAQNSKQEELIATTNEINQQIDKLDILITDILNMSLHHSNDPAFSMSGVDVYETAIRVVQELTIVHNREITLEGQENIFIRGNASKLSEVLINLITNALRYSPEKSSIVVSVRADETTAFLAVRDFGMGIQKENIDKIFERYYRVNHTDTPKEIGAGIGLYICSEIIKQHHGRLRVESEVGKGSTFTVEIPKLF